MIVQSHIEPIIWPIMSCIPGEAARVVRTR